MEPTIRYPCDVCPRLISEGTRCQACRLRKCRGHLVEGSRCPVPQCRVADPRMLRRQRFEGGIVVVCANHAALVGHRRLHWTEFLRELDDEAAFAQRRSA